MSMRQHWRSFLAALVAVWLGGTQAAAGGAPASGGETLPATRPSGALVLWYLQPAQRWLAALPLGNGRLGAMVWGGVEQETIGLDEITCWSGEPSLENVNPEAKFLLPQVRALLFQEKFVEAEPLVQKLVGRKLNKGTHLPFGNLLLYFRHAPGQPQDYRRTLDLDRAVATVSYRVGDTSFRREILASHPDQVIVIRLTADRPKQISFEATLVGGQVGQSRPEAPDTLLLDGHAYEPLHSDGHTGVALHGRLRAIAEGGRVLVRDGDARLMVDNANAVTLLIALGTTFGGKDPVALGRQQIETAAARPYAELCRRHVEDHGALLRRVALDLGPSPHTDWPTDRRLEAVRQGEEDPALAALMFQFARYLVIAGSRCDSPLPMHLQGVWNDNRACRMGWTCGYHLDINLQMQYWPTEVAALGECHEPLLRFVRDVLGPSGRHTAQAMYGCCGWVAHTVSDAWGYSAPGWNPGWGLHPTGGVWIASHLWAHYAFSGDKRYLAETAYPVLKEAAEFFLDYLSEEPGSGRLVSGPSCSPENTFLPAGDRRGRTAVSMGPTCDLVLVGQLFDSVIRAGEILGMDAELRARLAQARARLAPLQIGQHGQLQEWLKDYVEAIPGHRHTMHLLSVYPFDLITPRDTPELARAARVSIDRRFSAPKWESHGWSQSLMACYLARLDDGDAALAALRITWQKLTGENLLSHTSAKFQGAPIFEVDSNTGSCAAIAEMLLQSQRGQIHLLPALPKAWPSGCVRGLRARGGFEVDQAWSAGRLTRAVIHSQLGGTCTVRSSIPLTASVDGGPVNAVRVDGDGIRFETHRGKSYVLVASE